MKKRWFGLLAAMMLCLCVGAIAASAGDYGGGVQPEFDGGTCGGVGNGSNLAWSYYANGELYISGSGAMADWSSYSNLPWFAYRNDIKTVVIGNSVTTIGDHAFQYCYSLTEVTIGDSVTEIGAHAFYGCDSLTAVTIPDSVTEIGDYAFRWCDALTSIRFEGSAPTIGDDAFYNVAATCTYPADSSWTYDVRLDYGGTLTWESLPYGSCGENLTWVLAEDGTLTISGSGAMANWTSASQAPWYDHVNTIKSIVIEEGVTNIGDYAFTNCHTLTSVTLPDSVTVIGDYAFMNCITLTNVEIPDRVTAIGNSAFACCASLESVTIPASVTFLDEYVFDCCDSLTSVTFEGHAPAIGDLAFQWITITCFYPAGDNTWTDSVRQQYGGTLTWKMYYPRSGSCGEALTFAIADGTLTVSGSGAMAAWNSAEQVPWYGYREEIEIVVLENGVTAIGQYAFSGCESLTDVYYLGTAEKWAQVSTSESIEAKLHVLTLQNDNPPTCTEGGTEDYYVFADGEYPGRFTIDGEPITELKPVPALGHDKSYQIIDGELYHACGACDEKDLARHAERSGRTVTVTMEAEPLPMWIYAAVYDSEGQMKELKIVEVTAVETEITFATLTNADQVMLLFLNEEFVPLLKAMRS